MHLGLNLGLWGAWNDRDNTELARLADDLEYSVCWAAEAYGSDVATVLTWVAAHTRRIGVGSAVMQIPGRTPAMTAMTAATLDRLSAGRFRLGLGVSGPQVSEGWHGVRFDHPLARTREYVDVVRMALARKDLQYSGSHVTLPLPDGPGKPLHLSVRPVQRSIPVYLAAVGPANSRLAGEIADGWLGLFFAPDDAAGALDPLREGRRRAGHSGPDPLVGFDVAPTVPVSIADDLDEAADRLRPWTALYLGGMGSRRQNFYNALARRMGYEQAAQRVQDLYLDGRQREAAAAVPRELIDRTCLTGSIERIADRMHAYAESGVTTLSVTPYAPTQADRLDTLRQVAQALEAQGLRS
jgi:F420-dependent oxidoreductase-like protein